MDILQPNRLSYEHRDISNSTINVNSVAGSQSVLIQQKSAIPLLRKTPRKRLEIFLILSILLGIFLLVSLCTSLYLLLKNGEVLCQSEQCIRSASNYLVSMDKQVDPCNNFYKFACGKWSEEHDLRDPGNHNDWFTDRGWTQIRKIKDFLRKNDSDEEPEAVHKVRTLYRSCNDFESMEDNGYDRLVTLLEEIGFSSLPPVLNKTSNNTEENKHSWLTHLSRMQRFTGTNFLFAFGISNLPQNKTINKLSISSPLNEILPHSRVRREIEKREDYRVLKALKEAGDLSLKLTAKSMEDILNYFIVANNKSVDEFKTQISQVSTDLIYLFRNISDIEEEGNITSISAFDIPDEFNLNDLQDFVDSATDNNSSKINWGHYFNSMYEEIEDIDLDFEGNDTILVYKKEYFEFLSKLLDSYDEELLDMAIWWKVVYTMAFHTNEELADLKDAYLTRVLESPSGKKRTTTCAETTYALMEMAVGYQVVHNKDATKKQNKVKTMLEDMQDVYSSLVMNLNWMDRETKLATLDKVRSMKKLIGFPEWLSNNDDLDLFYENITLDEEMYLDNVLTIIKVLTEDELLSLRVPYQSDSFTFDPLDINAYYSFYDNYICVPEGILKYPFYDLGLEVLNYGALGVILGHELTHGFDNIGRRYDKEGNLRQWWSNSSIEEYSKKAECYVGQYGNFTFPWEDVHIDGKLTLSENLADNGGLREAYLAYKKRIQIIGEEPKLPGMSEYTHDQLFFLAFANMWCSEYTPVGLMLQLLDEHSPHFVRVLMSLRNFPEFSSAWKCPAGSKMNPVKKCKMWVN